MAHNCLAVADSSEGDYYAATKHKGAEAIHFFACKDPAWAVDYSFDGGEIKGRCRNVGSN